MTPQIVKLHYARDCDRLGRAGYLPPVVVTVPRVHPDPEVFLEVVWSQFNRHDAADQHPALDQLGLRSLSMGDVVEVDGVRWRVALVGFEKVAS